MLRVRSLTLAVQSDGLFRRAHHRQAVLVHSAAMLLVMALVAVLVFDRLGLALLRRAWLNVDRLWAGGLVGVGALTLLG
jgi:hypothetical protein